MYRRGREGAMAEIVRFGVSVPRDLLKKFDAFAASRGFKSRSQAISEAMRVLMAEAALETDREVAAVVGVLYDHTVKRASDRIVELGHRFRGVVLSAHVHLSSCLLYTSPSPRDRG